MLDRSVRLIVAALATLGVATAQQIISAKAGLVYFVFGQVSIAGSGRLSRGPVNRPLREGEVLLSESGRAEVLLNPATVLRIGNMTRIRMDNTKLTETRVSIETGSAVVTVNQPRKLDRVEVRIGGAAVVVEYAGVYRFDSNPAQLRVYSGQAEASGENGRLRVVAKRGQAVRIEDLRVSRFDLKDADALQQWAFTRGAPPPWIPLPPMKCYSMPTKSAEFGDWLKDCAKQGP